MPFFSYLEGSAEVNKTIPRIEGRLVHDGGERLRRLLGEDLVNKLGCFLRHIVLSVVPCGVGVSLDDVILEKRQIMEMHSDSGYPGPHPARTGPRRFVTPPRPAKVVSGFGACHRSPPGFGLSCSTINTKHIRRLTRKQGRGFKARHENAMSRGPPPSQLCLLSSVPEQPVGLKVRFLGW